MSDFSTLIARAEALLARLEAVLPQPPAAPDWSASIAFRYRRRGTGKSSLIKACLNEFADRGLRLIEVDKDDLTDLPDLVALVGERPEREPRSSAQTSAGWRAASIVASSMPKWRSHWPTMARYSRWLNG